jgi:hypothetical protein
MNSVLALIPACAAGREVNRVGDWGFCGYWEKVAEDA